MDINNMKINIGCYNINLIWWPLDTFTFSTTVFFASFNYMQIIWCPPHRPIWWPLDWKIWKPLDMNNLATTRYKISNDHQIEKHGGHYI
jgi:hypothetical protein